MADISYRQLCGYFGLLSARCHDAHRIVTLRLAEDFRREVVAGIQNQAPGGIPFTPLKPSTLAARRGKRLRGKKILIATAQLWRSITVQPFGDQVFVGVLRTAMRRDGTSGANIAAVHEFGTDRAGKFHNIKIPKRSFLIATYQAWMPGASKKLSDWFGKYLLTGKLGK